MVTEATAVTSDLARAVAHRNLLLKRPQWLPAFDALLQRIDQVPSALFELRVTLDEKDRPLLCAAIRAGCTHFATGDRRDFGHLFDQAVDGVRVVHLLRLAELLSER